MIIGHGQVKNSPNRTESLKELKIPNMKNKSEKPFQRLFGVLGYYRRYVKGYAHKEKRLKVIRETIYNTKGETQKIMDLKLEAENILLEIISSIKQNVLQIPSPNSDLILETDASTLASGHVLMLSDKKPILFGSKMWNKNESNYSIFEKELLSVLIAIRKTEPYLKMAKSVKVYSDNLASIINLKSITPICMSSKAIKYVLEIQTRVFGTNTTFTHIYQTKNFAFIFFCKSQCC